MNPHIHVHTPQLTAIDSRGLPVRQIDYWRVDEREPEARITAQQHAVAGRWVAQRDPRLFIDVAAPANLITRYSLSGQVLSNVSVDAGWRVSLLGEANQPLHSWDGRGSQHTTEYDQQLRPQALFEQARDGQALCAQRYAYGGSDPLFAAHNQCGQLIRHDDPAGTQVFSEFGLSGGTLEQTRHFLRALDGPDWPALASERDALLETGAGATSRSAFNALSETIERTDAKGHRQFFAQNLGGQLREVRLQLANDTVPRTVVSAIQYNAHGQTEQETAGNGVITALDFAPEDGRLTRLQARRGNDVLQDLRYVYDPVGNVLSIEDAALAIRYFANQRIEPINRYGYDSLYQLIRATGWEAGGANQGPMFSPFDDPAAIAQYTQTYRYDRGGNLLELTHNGAQQHGHRLLAAAQSNRCLPVLNGVEPDEDDFRNGFDANGNLLALQPGQSLHWDLRNQLREVRPVERDGATDDNERYIYGADGMRLRKVRQTQTSARTLIAQVRYLPNLQIRTHSGTGETLQVISVQAGRSAVQVLHWESEPPKSLDNDQPRYSLNDHLGSCTLELDSAGQVISHERYHPFGTTAWFAGRGEIESSYKTLRYSGKERDATGLYYYGFRYYVAWLQRWLNPDPAADAAGLNYFRFVDGNPVMNIDPDGLNSEKAQDLWRLLRHSVVNEQRDIVTMVPGIIAVSLEGDADYFQARGFDLSRRFIGKRTLAYLSIDPSYEGQIAGGDQPVRLKSGSASHLNAAINKADARWSAYLNGGFYNLQQRASRQAPKWASIGNSFVDGRYRPSLPLPAAYADAYVDLKMSNGSFIQTAPLLAKDGKAQFTEMRLQEARFKFDATANLPGELGHADQPNNRSAISLLNKESAAKDRTRLVIGIGDSRRKDDSSGFTMPEWSDVMARIDRLNIVPGESFNLDGGDSTALGVLSRSDVLFMDAGAPGNPNRSTGNFIAFSKKSP
jgi:insecticidal toxin complex protein TccC